MIGGPSSLAVNAAQTDQTGDWREATVDETEKLIQTGRNLQESFKVVRELRNVAKTGVDPIRPVLEENSFWGTAERGAYGLAGSLPLMGVTAVNPYLGALAYQAQEYDRIMLENPDINPKFAQGLALVEGVANAATDRLEIANISGRLPMFGRWLDRVSSDGVRRTAKIAGSIAFENLQEAGQDLIAPILEAPISALRDDMPDQNFTKLMDDWAGQRAETFFATLPLALIGGGVATYQDIKNPSAELNATKLRMAGFGKDQVTFIQRAENPEEYDARIKMEWEKRTPENIKAGEQEVLNTIEQARTPGENDARISEKVAEDGSSQWVVTTPDGKEILQTQDQQAALEAVRQHNEAQLINERNAVRDMVDYFHAQDPNNVATIEAPRTVQQELDRLTKAGDSKGIANLNERIRFAGIPEGADLTSYNILGEANVETTAEGVFRGVIKLRENSRPEDAFEEINHVFVRKALADGRVDLDALRGWLNQTSEATGQTYATETETDIIENIAKVGMDYAAGRIEETSLPSSFVDYIKRMLQVLKETMARAIKLKDAFATGKIDANFESFLADSVGLNQQARVDTARERVSNEVLTDTNYSIGVDSNDSLDYRIANGGGAITASQRIARDLGASSRAIQEAQPGTSSGDAELQAIRDAGSIPWEDIGAFGKPDTVASEHQIWFKEGKVFKATAYGKFGHSIEKGPGNALPLEYLRRIAATNEAFDDSARIVGKFEDKDGNLGLIHVQDFIPENPENPTQPTPKQITQFLESRGFFPAEGRPTNYEVWINPDLGIEVTDLHPGNLIVDATGKLVPIDVIANKYDSTKGVSYSIASQSEIDRVNKALGGMNRGPEGRLAIYERAKQKFAQILQSNKESLDAIKSSTPIDTAPAIEQVESERAAKLADLTTEETSEIAKALQDNADTFMPRIEAAATLAERKRVERDAKDRAKILEQGIRDKYAERKTAIETEANTQRQQINQSAASRDSASRARMSEKVRRTKLLQAIGELDAILSVLPPEVRGRVGGFAVLANIGTGDKALGDFFVKRIDMIDRRLERTLKEEYGAAFDSLLERTKPKKSVAGEKPKGIGADIQSLFAVVREAHNWSAEKVDGHIANIETQIASGNLTAEEEAMRIREADLVSLAGDWKNADSNRRAAALSAATETWAKGMSEFVQKKIREREDRDMARAEAISATGKKGDYVDRRKKDKADNGIKGDGKGWFMDTLAWDGVVNILFGHESPIAIRLSDGQRKAEYAKIDAVQAKQEALHDLFTKLAGGNRADGEKLLWKMSQPSIPANGLDLSEMEALSATMLWMQEDGRRHMEGELNENGMPVSKWHYDQKFIDEIESALSPEAKAVRDYLLDAYAKEWFAINSVYRELNGVNLPQIKNYSPVTVRPMNAPSGMVTDPVTGHAISATSISPGALRTRGTAIAEPAFRNVVQTYIAHTRQMEHWKAFAPWIKEANGILRFRDVQDSIHEAGGEEAIRVLNKFLDAFAQGGNRDASLGLKISEVLNSMASRAAQVALIGRVGTLAIQTTQIGAASAELPMGAYVYRLGKLLTGNLGWGDSLNSAYIQRRLKQMPPIVQIAMEGLKAGKPNQLKHQVEKIGRLISGSDALWTAGTYAMVYDYNLSQAKTLGYTGKAAEDYAHNTAERITDRLAQPTRMGAKSIYEITATNPGSRLGWAFASEARKNIALLAYTKANRPLKQFGAATLGFIVFNLAMGAFIRNAWKDMKDDGDDEDEFFDAKTWNWKRIGVAMATEPLQGIPFLGDYTQKGINAALGQYHQSSDLISFERGVRAIKHIPDIVQGEREMGDVLKDIDGMVSLMGIFDQNAAAAASLTHLASDFFGVAENAASKK